MNHLNNICMYRVLVVPLLNAVMCYHIDEDAYLIC